MKIVIYDDNWKTRRRMVHIIREINKGAEIHVFKETQDVLDYVAEHHPEVAFISTENEDGRGYFLIKRMRYLTPRTNVIAVANEYRYLKELTELRVSGYVTEGITKEAVCEEMKNLRYAV